MSRQQMRIFLDELKVNLLIGQKHKYCEIFRLLRSLGGGALTAKATGFDFGSHENELNFLPVFT